MYCLAALFAAHCIECDAEHFGGCGAVDVFTGGEGFEQAFVAREVRHDP